MLTLNAEQYPNACAVLFRVFVELSVDHYASEKNLLTDKQLRDQPLAKRMKVVAEDLHKKGKIAERLKDAIERVADSRNQVLVSTVTLNAFVHNAFVYPKASELRSSWDEIQPFVEKIWPA